MRSLGFALLIGLVAAPGSVLVSWVMIGGRPVEPWDDPLPWRQPLLWLVVSWLAAVGAAAMLAVRGTRLSAMAASVAGVILGYAAIAMWIMLSSQNVEFVNRTSVPLVVLYAREGDERLHQGTPILGPYRSYKASGFEKRGPVLRIVALLEDGRRVFDQTYTWSQIDQMGDEVVFDSERRLP